MDLLASLARRTLGTRAPWVRASALLAWLTLAAMLIVVTSPWLEDWTTFGFHDWDAQTAHRELSRLSLARYHQFPGWDPFACGGFPAWGYVEGDTILVSPWLPAYLALPMSVALRVEVLGQAALGVVGAYVLAGRVTTQHAARALVAALWAMNGRWGLQVAAGHTWFLAFAWTPWCLYFYDRAREWGSRVWPLVAAGACFAMLVYSGGIYPLPHTVLAVGAYAIVRAVTDRSARPLATLALAGAIGVGLSAPKLLPMLATYDRVPRLIDSTESLDLHQLFVLLTTRAQAFRSHPVQITPYGWHEWGMYISLAGVAILLAGVVLAWSKDELALKIVGLVFFALGMGAFHRYAPWTLLHRMPVFRSQHVPSRFHYTAVLFLSLVAAAYLGRLTSRWARSRPWIDVAAALVVLAVALDVASVARIPMTESMWMRAPPIPARADFHFEQEPPFRYVRRDWAGPMYLAILGNTGVMNCYGTPRFDPKGARPEKDPAFRGEVRIEGQGTAQVESWTPNEVAIRVDGAAEGDRLVWNMNFDEGWRARVEAPGAARDVAAEPFEDAVSARLPAGATRVVLSYSPKLLVAGLFTGASTLALALTFVVRERRRKPRSADLVAEPGPAPDA